MLNKLLTAVTVLALAIAALIVTPSVATAATCTRTIGSGAAVACDNYPEPAICRGKWGPVRSAIPGCTEWDAYVDLRWRVANRTTRAGTVQALFASLQGNSTEVATASLNTATTKGKAAYFESLRIVDDVYKTRSSVAKALTVLKAAEKVAGRAATGAQYLVKLGNYFIGQFTNLGVGIRLRGDAIVAYGSMP